MKFGKRLGALLLAVAMLVSLTPSVFAVSLPFADVSLNSWYREPEVCL